MTAEEVKGHIIKCVFEDQFRIHELVNGLKSDILINHLWGPWDECDYNKWINIQVKTDLGDIISFTDCSTKEGGQNIELNVNGRKFEEDPIGIFTLLL